MPGSRPCFIRSVDGDWLHLDGCQVKVEVRRRYQREVARDGEGDDLIDQGSESMEFNITGTMEMDTYLKALEIFRSGTSWLLDPFEEKELKTCFASLKYDGANGCYEFLLIEDVV